MTRIEIHCPASATKSQRRRCEAVFEEKFINRRTRMDMTGMYALLYFDAPDGVVDGDIIGDGFKGDEFQKVFEKQTVDQD